MTIIVNGRKFEATRFPSEKEFEQEITSSSKLLFGKSTTYVDAKKKIESKTLGAAVPDGFLFDFTDATDPQFYIVEVELSQHGFYSHIFPQITKFFAFFNNTRQQKSLVDSLFSIIDTDPQLRADFRKHLGHAEIYKFLSDIVEASQNILLVADGQIAELPEIMATYTDTWGRMVTFLEVKKYTSGDDIVYSLYPDIETLQYAEPQRPETDEEEAPEGTPYTEEFHLEGVADTVRELYSSIKTAAAGIDPSVRFNPQKYYVSIKAPKNVAFLKIRKKKIRLIAMMPEEEIRQTIKSHPVVTLSKPVQDFYNGPCAAVDVSTSSAFGEVERLIRQVIDYNRGA